jgi:endonuclease/exonuclease/phosphatase family metal-dependent hydrolase
VKLPSQISGLLQVASYNIHRCIGLDGLCHPDRVAAVIKELGVDVLGLQEVESCLISVDSKNQTAYLALVSGLNVVPGPIIFRESGHYGNALLARFVVQAVRQIDLSMPRKEPRGALDVDLDCHGRTVRVIVTHLGLDRSERKRQVARLLDRITVRHSRPTIFDRRPKQMDTPGPFPALPARFLQQNPRLRTFPSRLPVLPLDRIFVWPHETLLKAKVHISRLAGIASDHLPLKWYSM